MVADSHGNFQNLLVDRLPPDVEVVRGGPRPLGMMQGIDSTFDGAIFIGYHASTTNPAGVRAHTFSSANLADVKLNDRSVTEGAWGAALAAHFGVPCSPSRATRRRSRRCRPWWRGWPGRW